MARRSGTDSRSIAPAALGFSTSYEPSSSAWSAYTPGFDSW